MPIITPAYPSMCATHNITLSTKKIIMRELKRGGDIVDKIFTGQQQWKDLFGRHTFFTRGYKYYLAINSAAPSKEAQLVWSGFVASKVRLLVAQLEVDDLIEIAHPFNKGFDRIHHVTSDEERKAVLGGSLQYQAHNTKTETTDVAKDPKQIAAAQAEAGTEIVEPEDKAAPNGARVPAPTTQTGSTIYTTTYYIGIELAQGDYWETYRVASF